jgi:chromatin segregation and condensation protein Rec8/ScpA/Scc1 (kleisin family)
VKPSEKDMMTESGRDFQEMLHKLPARMDSKQREQISVPFCFICLLHLCNEKNLELSQQPDDLTSLFVRPGDS